MYGLEFREASNALICGSAEFEVRKRDSTHYYRVIFGPDGMSIDRPIQNIRTADAYDDGWERIKEHATNADIEAILPKRADFGMNWTFSQFMLALTFFGEGHKLGYTQGEWKGRELECNRIKYEQRTQS